MKSAAAKNWNDRVKNNVKKLGPVRTWLQGLIDDSNMDWESRKSAHHALKFLELAEYEMLNMQWWQDKSEQQLYFKAEDKVVGD